MNVPAVLCVVGVAIGVAGGTTRAGDGCGPVVLGEIKRQASSTSWNVDLFGSLAGVADFDGLYLVDVSDPANPVGRGFAPIAGIPASVSVASGYAAVGDNLFGVRLFSTQDPQAPAERASVDLSEEGYAGVTGVEVQGGRLFASSWARGFRSFTIGVNGSLTPFADYADHTGAGGMRVFGGAVYLAGSSPALTILDSETPGSGGSLLVGSFDHPDGALDVAAWTGVCFLATGAGEIVILDTTDPSAPTKAGTITLPGQPVAIETYFGDMLYVAESNFSPGGPDRVLIFDVRNPAQPSLVDEIEIPNVHGLDFASPVLYAASNNRGLVSLDLSGLCVTCPVDFRPDLVYNVFDLAAFLDLYGANDPRADLAVPFGTLNFFDVAAMLAAYQKGCL